MVTNSYLVVITVCLVCALFATLINISLHSHISDVIDIEHAKGMTTTATKEASLAELEIIGNDYINIEDDVIIPHNDTKEKPRLIIHVGPPKTATTTIQCGLHRYGFQLIHDNYYYLGKRCKGRKKKKGYQSIVNMLETHPIPRDIATLHKNREKNPNSKYFPSYLRSFLEELSHHYKQNHSVIISGESFDDLLHPSPSHSPLVDLFHSLVSQWDWHSIQIIVNYRRYSDWITSVYPRNLNHTDRTDGGGGWKDWEDQGGYVPPSVVDYIRGTFPPSIDGGGYDEWMQVLPSIRSHRAWSTLFSTVSTFNIHKPGDIVANFICDTIPHATTSCSAARGGEVKNENKNIRFFEYRYDIHRIVNTARKRGMLGNETLGRNEVFIKTRNQFGSLDGMEMLCLDGIERRRVYEMTMAIEQYMLPEWYEEENRRGGHETLKEKITNSTKYCGVDIEAVLRNQTWIDFFQSLT